MQASAVTSEQWVHLALKAGSIAALVGLLQWVVIYTVLESWWRNQVGRSLVLLAGLAMVTPIVFILALFFGLSRFSSQALGWAEAGVLFATFAAMVRRSYIWVKIARKGQR
jgi:drug/metabolite transporter (DMT)-like permease